MVSIRIACSTLPLLAVIVGACSSSPSAESASGGSPGTGGATSPPPSSGGVTSGGLTGSGGLTASGGLTSGGTTASGGASQPGTSGGALGSGGTATPATGGGTTGGRDAGSGGSAGSPASTGGSAGRGGAGAGTGGGGSPGAGGVGGALADGNAPVGSAGCDKTRTLQNGTLTIMFNNVSRKYILRTPDGYDSSKPYRLVFAYAESGSTATSVANRNYFTLATLDSSKSTIFVAPESLNGDGSWSKTDVQFTDAILAQLEGDLCIDKTRLFATGFSFGGAMSLAIACTRADVFRGVAFFSGADLTGSCTGTLTKPIAYYASQASQDSTGTPAPTSGRVKQADFAAVNGCTAEPTATTFPAAGQPHTCTIYKNCSAGHPTVYCVFDGPHGWEPKDPGQSMSWNAPEAWKFITQF